MEREVINPHDKIFIEYSDKEAAQVAILLIGNGQYGIDGDDGLPLLLFGGHEEWSEKTYGKSFDEWLGIISMERVALALDSMRIDGERSSLYDPVGNAHKMAKRIRNRIKTK